MAVRIKNGHLRGTLVGNIRVRRAPRGKKSVEYRILETPYLPKPTLDGYYSVFGENATIIPTSCTSSDINIVYHLTKENAVQTAIEGIIDWRCDG